MRAVYSTVFAFVSVALFSLVPSLALAGGIVGDGSPASCTDAAFGAALQGGGVVTFDCGAAPHSIIITQPREIQADTEIDGGGSITLSGANSTPFFQVFGQQTLLLDDITLALGFGQYGAIENFGTLTVADSRIENCTSSDSGGAIANYGTVTITEGSVISGNEAVNYGAGLFNDGGTATVENSEISSNELTGTAGSENGGGIYNVGSLTVSNATIRDNFARNGGGIYNIGTASITDSLLEDNSVSYAGPVYGGALHHASGNATVSGTRFVDNTALGGYAGGIFVAVDAGITITTSTFTENEAQSGGALTNSGSADVSDSTFHGNLGPIPAIGSGIQGPPGTLTLTNVTVSENEGDTAVYISGGSATIRFTTIAGNTGAAGALNAVPATALAIKASIVDGNSPTDCAQNLFGASEGFNVVSDNSCGFNEPGDDTSTDALLGPLADNGGPTLTHLPALQSPAVNGAPCDAEVTTDQRGIGRPQGLACDAGSVEWAPASTTTSTTQTTTTTLGPTTTTTLAGGDGCGDPVALAALRANAVTASDALAILNAAIGLFVCELCVCDVDDSGGITATDALAVLRDAVGLGAGLSCPPCS